MTSNDQLYNLTIHTSGPLGDFCHLIIFNGFNEIVKKDYGKISMDLPRGMYRLRLELNEESREEMIRLDQDVKLEQDPPLSHSSMPAHAFSSSYDYYTDEAVKWSLEPTTNKDKKGLWSAIFVFLRYPNADLAKELNPQGKSPGKGFSILDENRKVIYAFDSTNTKENPDSGWLAFHAPVKNGQYYIHYSGKQKREIPLYAFNGWQSQLFITIRDQPLFPSLKIATERVVTGFRPDNPVNYIMDASMQKMHNGIYFIPERIMTRLSEGNWENPMIALLTAYIYFNSGKRDKDEQFRSLLKNYDRIVLDDHDAPDLVALRMLAYKYFNEPLNGFTLSAPSMFLTGMKIVSELSAQHIKVYPENSFMETIMKKLYADMEWTSYDPPPVGMIHHPKPIKQDA